MTAKFIIEKHQQAVASYLGFNSGYLKQQEKKQLQVWLKKLQPYKTKIKEQKN